MRRSFNIFLIILTFVSLVVSLSGCGTTEKEYEDIDVTAKYKLTEASHIQLSGGRVKVPDGVSYKDKIVTINKGGSYVVTGKSKGIMIYVEAEEEVDIYLDNIVMEASGKPLIYSRSKEDVHLIAIDKTENVFMDSDEDYDLTYKDLDSVIYSGSNLTLEGIGKFSINSSKRMGVKGLSECRILDTVMSIDTEGNGICVDSKCLFKGGTYNIKSGNDCISTVDRNTGVLELVDAKFDLAAKNDGIHSENDLICTNPVIKVTESDEAMEGVKILINSGVYDLISNDDGINASSSDVIKEKNADGIEYGEIVTDGTNINYDTWIPSDGQHKDSPDMNCDITIKDGDVRIVAGDDGLDSNSSIHIEGGNIFVYGGPQPDGGSIDYETTASIDGGLLLAYGVKGMVTPFNEGSCNSILLLLPEDILEKSSIEVLSKHGSIVKLDTEKEFDCVLLAGSAFVEDEYTIKIGNKEYNFNLVDGHTIVKLK